VRHVDDGHVALAKDAENAEEALRCARLQRGRGLVEEEDPRVGDEGFRDLHELPLGERQVADQGAGPDGEAELVEDGLRAIAHLPSVDKPDPHRFPHGIEVAEHVQVGEQAQLLGDHGHAVAHGISRVGELDFGTVEAQGPDVGPDRARHHLDERGLAGAVLAEESMNGTRSHDQPGVVERDDAAVGLADPLRLERVHRGPDAYLQYLDWLAICSSPIGAMAAAMAASDAWRAAISSMFELLTTRPPVSHVHFGISTPFSA
jgi:hypothetical protein